MSSPREVSDDDVPSLCHLRRSVPKAVVLKPTHASQSPGEIIPVQTAGPSDSVSGSVRME